MSPRSANEEKNRWIGWKAHLKSSSRRLTSKAHLKDSPATEIENGGKLPRRKEEILLPKFRRSKPIETSYPIARVLLLRRPIAQHSGNSPIEVPFTSLRYQEKRSLRSVQVRFLKSLLCRMLANLVKLTVLLVVLVNVVESSR